MREKPVFKKIIDFEEAKELIEQMRHDRGYPSGYRDLDKLCGGLVKDGVTLIAARPAMGKTSLALNFVSRLSVEQGGTILIFSPQMWSDEITIRLLSIAMNLEPENFLNNKVPPATIAAKFLDYYAGRFFFGNPDTEVYIFPGSTTIDQFLDTQAEEDAFAEMERTIPEGSRNSTLSHAAGKILKRWGDTKEAAQKFLEEAEKCSPPLDRAELQQIWNSALKFYRGRRNA